MPKINSLTPSQIARFPEFVKKWTDIGLCTDPADRPRAEVGIRTAYEIAGHAPPKQIVWCGSPFSMGLTRAIVMGLGSVDVGDNKKNSVWDSVGDSVGASVWDSVRASVGDSVRASVGDSVWASVWASVYGQHEAGWLSFYDYFALVSSLSAETQKLTGIFEVAQSAGWWLPHQNICWISDRHNVLNRNEDGRLHCEDGPALGYPDGWFIWAINGVRVDEQIIMRPETQTIEQIGNDANEESRRIRIERFGWPLYLKESGATSIDGRVNDVDGTEERLMRLGDGSLRLLCACRSTARVYAVGVPREILSCEQAQKWMVAGSSAIVKRGTCVGAS